MWSNCWPLPLAALHYTQIACVWQTWSLWVSRFETVQNVWWGLFLSIWILRENLCELLSSYFSFPGPKWGHTGQLRIALGQKLNWGGESERKKIESHDEDDGPNSGFSSQASISSLRLGVFYHFFTAAVTPLWLRYFLFWSRTTG